MSINTLYHDQYRGDFTATGASIAVYMAKKYLKAPEITDPTIFQATRGKLVIPDTATVERAFLVWAGDNYGADVVTSSLYLRTPASRSASLADANYIFTDQYEVSSSWGFNYYGFSSDVTDLVKKGGSGDYWVYNFDMQPLVGGIPGKAGWSLYVFYKDETASYKNLSFYAGLLGVGALFTTPVTITLDGILTPSEGEVLGRIGATTLNATAGESDSFYVNSTPMSDDYTPVDDFSNSISTLNNALIDSWPPQTIPPDENCEEYQTKVVALKGDEVPNDATEIDVSIDVPRYAPTSNDQIVAIVTAFELYSANISIVKTADKELPNIGDTLTYTVEITNSSSYSTVSNSVFTDIIPSKLSYVAGSMRIVSNNYGGYAGALTDAIDGDNGDFSGGTVRVFLGPDATPSGGGTLLPGDKVTIEFQAVVISSANIGDLIKNTATVTVFSSYTGEEDIFNGKNTVKVVGKANPVKTANRSTFRTDTTAKIDFKVLYPTVNIKNDSCVIVIEDQIDSILQIDDYYLDLAASANITISDESSGNNIKFRITTTGTESFPDSFILYVETTYLKDTVEGEYYTIINEATLQKDSEEILKSNTVYIISITKRDQAKIDIIESVALQQTALSHILNAEGKKIQKAVALDLNLEELLAINESVRKTVNSVINLENILLEKLTKSEENF